MQLRTFCWVTAIASACAARTPLAGAHTATPSRSRPSMFLPPPPPRLLPQPPRCLSRCSSTTRLSLARAFSATSCCCSASPASACSSTRRSWSASRLRRLRFRPARSSARPLATASHAPCPRFIPAPHTPSGHSGIGWSQAGAKKAFTASHLQCVPLLFCFGVVVVCILV